MAEVYRLSAVPGREACVFALSRPFVKPHHWRMFLADRNAPRATIGVEEMARELRVARRAYVDLRYGVLARRVAALLGLRVPTYSPGSTRPSWTAAPAEGGRESPDRIWLWPMSPEVCAATDELGWAP